MAAITHKFSFESHGLETPCRLIYTKEDKEVVRFSQGLSGKAVFSEMFSSYAEAFKKIGIDCRKYASIPEALRGKVVRLEDAEFGQAFFHVYFPEMQKHGPESYSWEVLSNEV